MDSVEGSTAKSPVDNSSNPSHYGYIYSAERPKPPPEVGWKERTTDEEKISLYSENVVQEGDTTETVDRESIANLSSTKKQWETIFTSSSGQGETPARKKSTPKWEVRLPYKERHSAPAPNSTNHDEVSSPRQETAEPEEDPDMFRKPVNNESAIEREIRLAHEREEMLRREKEERQKHAEKQHVPQGQTIIASYQAVSAESESCQPAYNELTEADRGPDLWRMEAGGPRDEDEESDDNVENANPNESIIEREIRLQREREAEVAGMKRLSSNAPPQQEPVHQQQQSPQYSAPPSQQYYEEEEEEEEEDVNHNQMKGMKYEDAIAHNSHDGESLIARELRELKEREEEIKRLHTQLQTTQITDDVDGRTQAATTPRKPSTLNAPPANSLTPTTLNTPSPGQGTWQKDVKPFVSSNRRTSVDSLSSHSTGRTPSDSTPRRDIRVQPLADGRDDDDDDDDKPNYFQRQETPIEREMRLARERENELRRQKGLPELVDTDDSYSSYGASADSTPNTSVSRPRSLGQPGDSMKKFASSRLQQELMQQKQREITLRSEGKIISTSEEHIEPLKYMAVAGVDKVDGKEKRNFVTKRTSVSQMEPETPGTPDELKVKSPSAQQPTRKISAAAGGQLFSYKEFKQTAESKIERELREMREREEELRMQRTGAQPETPR